MWLKEIDSSWTLFLDRDGVINQRNFNGYITSVENFHFTPYFLDTIPLLSKIFGKIIVVTNQQGVGKGEMSIEKLHEIHTFMQQAIQKQGGEINHVMSATNLKNTINDRRKPLPNMALEAKIIFPGIDFTKSVMIGDTNSDIQFGINLGMKTILVKSKEKVTAKADLEIEDFNELKLILQ
jgi:D-glycero-D-manno-heptose 1,7-bisphosphate phosphatase